MEDLLSIFQCESCEATYKISHSMETSNYKIRYCPFCATDNFDEDEIYEESFLDDSD